MRDVMVPSKRRRAPSLVDKPHPDEYSEKKTGQVQMENFLEICRFCKRSLRHDEDVFMYGYFGAFCSKACRAKQMACDIFMDSSAKAKKGRTTTTTCVSVTKPKPKDEAAEPRFFI